MCEEAASGLGHFESALALCSAAGGGLALVIPVMEHWRAQLVRVSRGVLLSPSAPPPPPLLPSPPIFHRSVLLLCQQEAISMKAFDLVAEMASVSPAVKWEAFQWIAMTCQRALDAAMAPLSRPELGGSHVVEGRGKEGLRP